MSYSFPDLPAGISVSAPATARPPAGLYRRLGKRALDIGIVLLSAPFVVPLVAVLWLLTALQGGGGFYRQARIGRGGRVFQCWKIRTMAPDAEARLAACLAGCPERAREWQRSQKLRNDPRITRLGRVLRATSLDELPQFWNVLKGEMSLIGPRPFTPAQKARYDAHPSAWAYYGMRPGLSGLWQVSARHAAGFHQRADFDMAYWQTLSLAGDMGIMLRTFAVVLRATGC